MAVRFPSIPPSRLKDAAVDNIKELVEIWKGDRGNRLDRVITYRDLVDSKLGRLSPGGNLQPGDAVGDAPQTSVGPLTNLVASGGFRFIFLDWDGTNQPHYSYTEIWRSSTDNLGTAVLLGTTQAALYVDSVGDGLTYYYWVRAVSTSGAPGPYNATAGTSATSALAPSYIIGQITGLISKSELASDVLTPVNQIPGINTTLADHNTRIAANEAAVADLTNIPAYDTATDYAVDDMVFYNDLVWRALVAMTAPAPTPVEGSNWTEVGQYRTFSDVISANSVAIDDLDVRITTNEGTLTSYGTSITALENRVTDTENDISGNSSAITSLDSRVTANEGSITSQASDITLLRSDVDTALFPLFDANESYAVGDFFRYSDTVYEVIATQATPNATPPNASYYDVAPFQGAAGALQLLDTRVDSAEGNITSQGSAITQLETTVNDPATGVDANAGAISSLDTRVTSAEGIISSHSSSITQIESEVDGNTAAIQTKAETSVVQDIEDDVTSIKAQYTVKLDVNGRVAGIGLMNDGATSEFVVAADSVYFIDPGQSITAFNPATNYSSMQALRDTQFVFGYAEVEGFKRFAINVPAYIPEGYITNAMIGNAAINQAQIVDLNVSEAEIADLAVTSAKIANVLQSSNYAAGSQGWRITKSGQMEINNILARGTVSGSRIEGSTIEGSAIIGSAFLAYTEAGSPYAGLTSTLTWSASAGFSGWSYTPYCDIFSANYSNTDQYRRFRRYRPPGHIEITSDGSAGYNADYRVQVYRGGSLVADTGTLNRFNPSMSNTYLTATWSGSSHEECYTDCLGTHCNTVLDGGKLTVDFANYQFSGNSQLRYRVYCSQAASYTGSFTAFNDY